MAMVVGDRFDQAAGVIVDIPGGDGPTAGDAEAVMEALWSICPRQEVQVPPLVAGPRLRRRSSMSTIARNEAPEAGVCAGCQLVPLSILELDLPAPIGGWEPMLRERGVELTEDDIGRLSIAREDARALMAERRRWQQRHAEEAARHQEELARERPIPGGIPATGDDATAFETLATGPGYTPARAEFGRPAPTFLEEELAEGQRRLAAQRAEAQAFKQAKQVLDDPEAEK